MGQGESHENSLRVLGGEREPLYQQYIDQHGGKEGVVSIRGMRMAALLGMMLHNGIVVDIPGDPLYIAFQFGSRGLHCYRAGSLRGSHRRTLGSYPLKKIYAAAQTAFKPGYDCIENNCNHYVNRFLQLFGESPPFECMYS